jgi:hypothetical protein
MAPQPPSSDDTEIIGRVVDDRGAPVPNALVALPAGTAPVPEIALVSDAHGRFSLRLPPGQFTLSAHAEQGSGQIDVETSTGSRPGEVVIVIRH